MSTTKDNGGNDLDSMSIEAIEAELKQFEVEERKRLGLPAEGSKHWFDEVPRTFTRDQREHTTILVSGLTMAHDLFPCSTGASTATAASATRPTSRSATW